MTPSIPRGWQVVALAVAACLASAGLYVAIAVAIIIAIKTVTG